MAKFILKLLNIHSDSIQFLPNQNTHLRFIASTISEYYNVQYQEDLDSSSFSFKNSQFLQQQNTFCYTYDENFSISANAQKQLTFNMDRYIYRDNRREENPFVQNIVTGSQLLLIDKYDNHHLLTVKDIGYTFKSDNIVVNYTATDSFTYQLSRQNQSYQIENDINSIDFIGSHNIDWWVQVKIIPECNITYEYVPMNEYLYSTKLERPYLFAHTVNIQQDQIKQHIYKQPLSKGSDYYQTVCFSASGTPNSVLINLGEQLSLNLQTLEYLTDDGYIYRYFWFEPKQKNTITNLYYSPYNDIESFSIKHTGANLSSILHVTGPTFGDETITLFPSLPSFFHQLFHEDSWISGKQKFETGFFTTLCQHKVNEMSKNNIDGMTLDTNVMISETFSLVDAFENKYTCYGQIREEPGEPFYLFIPLYDENKTNCYNIPKYYDAIKFSLNNKNSFIEYNTATTTQLQYNTENNWSIYVFDNSKRYIIRENIDVIPEELKDQSKTFYAFLIVQTIDTPVTLNDYHLYCDFYRNASDEELEFAAIADQCPWLENKLVDFSYFYKRSILNKSEYDVLIDLFTNKLRIINSQLMMYSQLYYEALHRRTKILSDLEIKLDTLGAQFESELLNPFYQNNKLQETIPQEFLETYNAIFLSTAIDSEAQSTQVFDLPTVLDDYLNKYIVAEQSFLKNIYEFRKFFEEKISFLPEDGKLHKFTLTLENSGYIIDNDILYQYALNTQPLIYHCDDDNFDQYCVFNGKPTIPVYYNNTQEELIALPSEKIINQDDFNDSLSQLLDNNSSSLYAINLVDPTNYNYITNILQTTYDSSNTYYEKSWNVEINNENDPLLIAIKEKQAIQLIDAIDHNIKIPLQADQINDTQIHLINKYHYPIAEHDQEGTIQLNINNILYNYSATVEFYKLNLTDIFLNYLWKHLDNSLTSDQLLWYYKATDQFYPTKTNINAEPLYVLNPNLYQTGNIINNAWLNTQDYRSDVINLHPATFASLGNSDNWTKADKKYYSTTPTTDDPDTKFNVMFMEYFPITEVYIEDYAIKYTNDSYYVVQDKQNYSIPVINATNYNLFYRRVADRSLTRKQHNNWIQTPLISSVLYLIWTYCSGFIAQTGTSTRTLDDDTALADDDIYDALDFHFFGNFDSTSKFNTNSALIWFLRSDTAYEPYKYHWTSTVPVQLYDQNIRYQINSLVQYNHNYYKALYANINKQPNLNTEFWTQLDSWTTFSGDKHYYNYYDFVGLVYPNIINANAPLYKYKTDFIRLLKNDDLINKNDSYSIIVCNNDIPFDIDDLSNFHYTEKWEYNFNNQNQSFRRLNASQYYPLLNYMDHFDFNEYWSNTNQTTATLSTVLNAVFGNITSSGYKFIHTTTVQGTTYDIPFIVVHNENYCPVYLPLQLYSISLDNDLENQGKQLQQLAIKQWFAINSDIKIQLIKDITDLTEGLYYKNPNARELQLATTWDPDANYYAVELDNNGTIIEETATKVYTIKEIETNNFKYFSSSKLVLETLNAQNKDTNINKQYHLTVPIYKYQSIIDNDTLISSSKFIEKVNIDLYFDITDGQVTSITLPDLNNLIIQITDTAIVLGNQTNGQFWWDYQDKFDIPLLQQHAAIIETTLQSYWTSAWVNSKYCQYYLPEHWQPMIDNKCNNFSNELYSVIEDNNHTIVHLSNQIIPEISLEPNHRKYTFKCFANDTDYYIYIDYLSRKGVLDEQFQPLDVIFDENYNLQELFSYLNILTTTSYKWLGIYNYMSNWYIVTNGGRTWQDCLHMVSRNTQKLDYFGGWYDMAIKTLTNSYYINQEIPNYQQALKQHNDCWTQIYNLFPNVILEQSYKNETATTSKELFEMAQLFFKDYLKVETSYNISTIDISNLKNYQGQEIHIGDPIAINADEYYDGFGDLRTSLEQYLFVTDIKYNLRKDSNISLTVNTIKYGDKVIKELINLIR